jgi:hypothetical protein
MLVNGFSLHSQSSFRVAVVGGAEPALQILTYMTLSRVDLPLRAFGMHCKTCNAMLGLVSAGEPDSAPVRARFAHEVILQGAPLCPSRSALAAELHLVLSQQIGDGRLRLGAACRRRWSRRSPNCRIVETNQWTAWSSGWVAPTGLSGVPTSTPRHGCWKKRSVGGGARRP